MLRERLGQSITKMSFRILRELTFINRILNRNETSTVATNYLDQPCLTSDRLAECDQKGQVVWAKVPLQQEKVETHLAVLSTK